MDYSILQSRGTAKSYFPPLSPSQYTTIQQVEIENKGQWQNTGVPARYDPFLDPALYDTMQDADIRDKDGLNNIRDYNTWQYFSANLSDAFHGSVQSPASIYEDKQGNPAVDGLAQHSAAMHTHHRGNVPQIQETTINSSDYASVAPAVPITTNNENSNSKHVFTQKPKLKKSKGYKERWTYGLHRLLITEEELKEIRPSYDWFDPKFRRGPTQTERGSKRRITITESERKALEVYRESKGVKTACKPAKKKQEGWEEAVVRAEAAYKKTLERKLESRRKKASGKAEK